MRKGRPRGDLSLCTATVPEGERMKPEASLVGDIMMESLGLISRTVNI